MSKKENKEQRKKRKEFDKGRVFVKIMAGILVLLMLTATGTTIIYALI